MNNGVCHDRCDWFTLAALAVAAIVPLCLEGCRRSGPSRYDLSGAVRYAGRPVEAGTLLFEPDTSRGNHGPGVLVEIADGRYRTLPGKGTVGGPHIVRIAGYHGQPASESPYGAALFAEYPFPIDLPRHAAVHDFDVPSGRE